MEKQAENRLKGTGDGRRDRARHIERVTCTFTLSCVK